MDPAGVGAIIGISIMVGIGICIRLNDLMKRKKNPTNPPKHTHHTPLISKQPPTEIALVATKPPMTISRQHSKISMVIPRN